MVEVVVLILSVMVNSVLGLAVIIKNPKKDLNRLFFYLTVSLSVWLIATYVSTHPFWLAQITWVRFVLSSAAVLSFFVLASFAVFPDGKLTNFRYIKPAIYYLIFVVVLTQTPLVFKSLDYSATGDAHPVVGPGIVLFMLLAVSFLGGAIFNLVKKFRNAKSQIKNQIRVVIFGIAVSFAGILFTNLFLVSVFKNTSLISFAPALTLILTGSMAYAILKHKLFDLRPAVARSMAYLMSFSLLIIAYSVLAFRIGDIFYRADSIDTGQRIFYVGLAVITALAFQPIKRFFDRATNKIFFRDAYEPQILLDGVSNILVANISLDPLLKQISNIVSEHMKVVNCYFIIHHKDGTYRTIGITDFEENFGNRLVIPLKHQFKSIVLTDELTSKDPKKEMLTKLDTAAVIKLSTKTASVGFMLVGNKKSGNIINPVDLRVIGIIADELAIAIENALRFEEIEQFNVTLQQKIDDATLKLKHANTRLKELDEAKDEFVSMASHQLRTPLTVIKGYLSMLLEGDMGKVTKQQKEIIQTAYDGAERMVFLIGDLLNVSRLQTGKFQIENQPSDLSSVIDHEVSHLQESAANHQLKLTFDKPKDFPKFMLDETKIRQVIMNFIDNAIYYTPAGGSIDVKLEATDQEIRFTVNDTGLGVPKSEQHHLFSKFYRAGNARKMRPDGTGLGLYMAKKIIVAQGGAIIFKSEEGKGSTFGFSLPKKAVGQ